MIILGIETSCDETAAAVLTNNDKRITIVSNVTASSAKLQAKYGGIIPEQAAREQIKSIIPVIETAINDSRLTIHDIDAIAVTYGPGLIGSLLVGVETAKTLSRVWNKPLIPVNHLIGHFYANWIQEDVLSSKYSVLSIKSKKKIHNTRYIIQDTPKFPCLGLLVSGGHTDLVLFESHGKYKYLGGTRDDAAGECFDKCARLLGLSYPGGAKLSQLAQTGNPKAFKLPRPMIDSKDFDFSFSGLKTAVANLVKELKNPSIPNLCAAIESAIVDVLVSKTILAAKLHQVNQITVAGGVAANQKLKNDLRLKIKELRLDINLHIPSPELCTDNAAMIAAAGFFTKPTSNRFELQANPNLSLSNT